MTGLYRIRGTAGQVRYRKEQDVRNAKTVSSRKKETRKQERHTSSRHAELPRSREYNTAPVSKARDGKSSTKSGTSSETDTVTATAAGSARSAGSAGSTAKPAELE